MLIYPFLGAAEDMAHSSLRFGIGRFTTEAEVDYVVEKIVSVVQRFRDMRLVIKLIIDYGWLSKAFVHSPLWEMVQEGIDINSINLTQH